MKNKNIVITGTTDGIGYALASQLIKQKTNLICINRSSEKADKFHEELDTSNVKFLDLITDLALLDEAKCIDCLLYTSPSPRDRQKSRMPSSA